MFKLARQTVVGLISLVGGSFLDVALQVAPEALLKSERLVMIRVDLFAIRDQLFIRFSLTPGLLRKARAFLEQGTLDFTAGFPRRLKCYLLLPLRFDDLPFREARR